MHRFWTATVIMVLTSFISNEILAMPWWMPAVLCFVVALNFKLTSGKAFLAGFVAVFLLWLSVALFKDYQNEHILSERMATLFKLNNRYLFLSVAALLGGIVGGFAALSAALLRKAFVRMDA